MARERSTSVSGANPPIAGQATAGETLVPSRRQYLELKGQHPGAVLLYRMGDFYETFDDDAVTVAQTARITLTSRSFGRNGRVPMAGIPYHALNHYLGRLLGAGLTVAIAEQLSAPGKGLVERGITRVLSPGTIADPALLPPAENRYLVSRLVEERGIGLAWVDVSTGEFALTELRGDDRWERLEAELARLNPAELLVPRGDEALPGPGVVTRLEEWHFQPRRAEQALLEHFGLRSLAPLGCEGCGYGVGAAGAILAYLSRTNSAVLPLLTSLRTEFQEQVVLLDARTRRNLELTESFGTGGRRGSLLSVLDHSRTSMGARRLRSLIGHPLRDLAEIRRRQAIVAALVEEPRLRAGLAGDLATVGDLARLLGRAAPGAARDFLALSAALEAVPTIQARLRATGAVALRRLAATVDPCRELSSYLALSVEESREGSARLRDGFSQELDVLRRGAGESGAWLRDLERRERERTGIKSLKIADNKVFGYYIEVTRPNLSLVPADYRRKQTIANGERFVTVELERAAAGARAAEDALAELESRLLATIAARVAAENGRLVELAERLALLDALLSLAEAAARGGWTRPRLDRSDALVIEGGRHPVVEAGLDGESFIPNDCRLGGDRARVAVVTGPNMGGKSTYLRQVALIVLLAQIGSFVPAEAAHVGLADRIFSRVGAHDDLAAGASTFMVEMVETATILRQATPASLVILDEVGRGTSAADGRAIAQAVLEDLHNRVRARTLFATHYLELTAVANDLPRAANLRAAALEQDGQIVFLYTVQPGAADQTFGIHVARLAGLPSAVAARASELLATLADSAALEVAVPELPSQADGEPPLFQLKLEGPAMPLTPERRMATALRGLDLASLTPLDALAWLEREQQRLARSKDTT